MDLSDYIQRMAYLGLYETNESSLVKRLLRPGMTFFDVGANVGYYTALAARAVGRAGCVFSFEPSPLFAKLEAMVSANRLQAVRCFNLGLSSENGILTLYVPPEKFHNYDPSAVRYMEEMTELRVPVRRLDEVIEEASIRRVDLLKVDIEGHEPHMLAGAERAIGRGVIRRILCEVNSGLLELAGSSPDALFEWLTTRGFSCSHGPRQLRGGIANALFVYQS